MCVLIELRVMGINFVPDVVPLVFAKYKGLPGQRIFFCPLTTLSI